MDIPTTSQLLVLLKENRSLYITVIFFAITGLLLALSIVWSFVSLLLSATIGPFSKLKKYAGTNTANKNWAVVTGGSDGIGKEFAIQLAKAKFNLVLISRTASKLKTVASEIEAMGYGVQIETIPLDFAKATDKNYQSISDFLAPLPVSILVNNVGTNHDIPIPFHEESVQVIDDIVNVNIKSIMRITHLVLPLFLKRSKQQQQPSLVLNVGSFAGVLPTPYLSVYSGSKAFLSYWSQCLARELAPHKIHVEYLSTYFVTSAMSKIRRSSIMIPNPKTYVKAVLSRAGNYFHHIPYGPHQVMYWVMQFVSKDFLIDYIAGMQRDIRKRALRKRARDDKSQ